ncbi:MAG: hypothetical protein ACE5Q6_22685, partial [Dehalococcoidia bacterium]
MSKALIDTAAKLRGAPITIISLTIIVVLGVALFYGRPSAASAEPPGNEIQLLPTCNDANDVAIPAQIHIPITGPQLEEVHNIPQGVVLTDTLDFQEPVTTTSILSATGMYDYGRLLVTNKILRYPLQETVALTNTWQLEVQGTTNDVDASILDELKPTLLDELDFYAFDNADALEFGGLPIDGQDSMAISNTVLAFALGNTYNNLLTATAEGDIPNYSAFITYTRASTAETVGGGDGTITYVPT